MSRRRQWQLTLVLLPGKCHGRRSLVGCSSWGHEELDMTEWLPFHFSLSCTGEGHGNRLQCSCLENPRDGGAWRAAVSGVAQRSDLAAAAAAAAAARCVIDCTAQTRNKHTCWHWTNIQWAQEHVLVYNLVAFYQTENTFYNETLVLWCFLMLETVMRK